MSVIDSHISLGCPVIGTSAAGDDELGSAQPVTYKVRWRAICDELLAWWNDPEAVTDEGEVAPTRDLIEKALGFVTQWREQNDTPPTRFAPSIDGGIAFEWESGAHLNRVVFLNSMRIEIDRFVGTTVVSSQHLEMPK